MKKYLFLFLFVVAGSFANTGALQAQTGKNAAIEALGGSCGMLLYNTYLAIGGSADGYGAEVYDSETIIALMGEQESAIQTVIDQYQKLVDSGFLSDPQDQDYVKRAIKVLGLLKKEATALKVYAQNGSEAESETYDEYRQNAWDALAELLGLD